MNGAIHYSECLLRFGACDECIAIGVNGYLLNGEREPKVEFMVFYISYDNAQIPVKLAEYKDFSFMMKKNLNDLLEKIEYIGLPFDVIQEQQRKLEIEMETKLLKLNQDMNDIMSIEVGKRVNLISGMIMAGLNTEDGNIQALKPSDLKGNKSQNGNDGAIIFNQIKSFLESKNLPQEKKEQVLDNLKNTFLHNDLSMVDENETESTMKKIYTRVKEDIMPIFTSKSSLDFTGKLFNVLNEWVDVPDGGKNDVVLTPRYVCDLMARICKVDMNSYVWDYTAGSAGFLVQSMRIMREDAKRKLSDKSPKELNNKLKSIREKQLLGIEKLPDMYMLAVLNMILMQDGSTNILHGDSLKFDGKYEFGKNKGKKFPANVFLLNPPYSAPGKGFIFVKNALKMMDNGYAAILIQENAGSGNGGEYTKELLENNTLIASIHMADIFKGKSNVQAAIYLFEVGKPHDKNKMVKFIDFSDDGYQRQNRKKSNSDVNLRDVGNAKERYDEVVKLCLYGKGKNNCNLKYLSENNYIEDYISLNGNDWTFAQHKENNTIPSLDDFKKIVSDYLSYKVSEVLRNGEVSKKV